MKNVLFQRFVCSLSDTKLDKAQGQVTNLDAISSYPSGMHKVHHGWFDGSASGTKPFTDGHLDTYVWRNNGAANDYITQIAYEDNSSLMKSRAYSNNAWSAWNIIATDSPEIDLTNTIKANIGATGACSCYVKNVGGLVHINLNLQASSTNMQVGQFNTLAELPAGYRPKRACYMSTCDQSGNAYLVEVDASGAFLLYPATSKNAFIRLSMVVS